MWAFSDCRFVPLWPWFVATFSSGICWTTAFCRFQPFSQRLDELFLRSAWGCCHWKWVPALNEKSWRFFGKYILSLNLTGVMGVFIKLWTSWTHFIQSSTQICEYISRMQFVKYVLRVTLIELIVSLTVDRNWKLLYSCFHFTAYKFLAFF